MAYQQRLDIVVKTLTDQGVTAPKNSDLEALATLVLHELDHVKETIR